MSKEKIKKKILLFAYACEPYKGSEPGVGWNWAVHLSKYVNVTVVTRANNRNIIENELKSKLYPNLSFSYFDIPIINRIKKIIPFGIQFYYLLWEFFVIKKIKKIEVDIIQRITFVSTVSLLRLYKLNIPYIISFCAGGEISPISIYKSYSYYIKLKEKIRSYYNSAYRYNIITKKLFNNSNRIIAVTRETNDFINVIGCKREILVEPAIGLSTQNHQIRKEKTNRIIYAGSLIYWKNVDIPIKAIQRVEKKIKFEIFGAGEKKKEFEKYVLENNLGKKVIFNSPISREILLKKYIEYDLALHASSHDSGSMFLLEAISNGVPVLFLDTGGPKEIFSGLDYPLKVSPNQTYTEIVNSFTERINWFYKNYECFMESFSVFQEKIIEKYDWDNKAKRMVEIYKEVLNENFPSS